MALSLCKELDGWALVELSLTEIANAVNQNCSHTQNTQPRTKKPYRIILASKDELEHLAPTR